MISVVEMLRRTLMGSRVQLILHQKQQVELGKIKVVILTKESLIGQENHQKCHFALVDVESL